MEELSKTQEISENFTLTQKLHHKEHTWGLPRGTWGSIGTSMGAVCPKASDENEDLLNSPESCIP